MAFDVFALADPATGALSEDAHNAVSEMLDKTAEPEILAPRAAVRWRVAIPPAPTFEAVWTGRGVDIAVLPAERPEVRLLVADMDATIVAEETLDEIAAHARVGDAVAQVTAKAMAGELDFEAALTARVALLEGLPEQVLLEVTAKTTLNPGADTLIRTLAARGVRCVLATGGFHTIAGPVAEACGFHAVVANDFEIKDGRLTGRVKGAPRGPQAKFETLMRESAALGGPAHALAVGDGANDALMLEAAEIGVAYRGKAPARAAANVRLDHGTLAALLHLAGVPASEIVAD